MWYRCVRSRQRVIFLLLLILSAPKPVFGTDLNDKSRLRISRQTMMAKDTLMSGMLLTDALSNDSMSDHPKSLIYKRPGFLSVKYTGGSVVRSNPSVRGENRIPFAHYAEAKYGFSVLGNRWKDIAYGMPYYGIGVGVYDFNRDDFGYPISAYLFQGATLYEISSSLFLKYEWNLGASFNWKTYDPETNPRNECVSAPVNVYFAGNLYLSWMLSRYWDFNAGLSVNHVSNGATRMPNSGLNTVGAYVGLTYNFDRERIMREYNPFLTVPEFRARFISDITVHGTTRQRKVGTDVTGLSSPYIDHTFFVMGASYALLHMPGYKYRYGLGIDAIYDESANFTARKVGENPDGTEITHINYGRTKDRFALGLSLRGEMVLPKYVVGVQVGYDIIHNNRYDDRMYQAISVKVPFWQGMYGSFAIRCSDMSKAQYLLFGMGYTIEHKPYRRDKKK